MRSFLGAQSRSLLTASQYSGPGTLTKILLLLGTAAMLGAASIAWFLAAPAAAAEPVDAMRVVGNEPADQPGSTQERPKVQCDACGIVVSTRPIAATGIMKAKYEIAVRLRDGSRRVFEDSSPPNWHTGETMIFIEGARSPAR